MGLSGATAGLLSPTFNNQRPPLQTEATIDPSLAGRESSDGEGKRRRLIRRRPNPDPVMKDFSRVTGGPGDVHAPQFTTGKGQTPQGLLPLIALPFIYLAPLPYLLGEWISLNKPLRTRVSPRARSTAATANIMKKKAFKGIKGPLLWLTQPIFACNNQCLSPTGKTPQKRGEFILCCFS